MTRVSQAIVAALFAALPFLGLAQTGKGPAMQMPGDNGKVGTPYQLGTKGDELVFTLEKAELASRYFGSQAAIGDSTVESGHKFVVLTISIKNASLTPDPLHDSIIRTKVTDADGGELRDSQYWAKNSTSEKFTQIAVAAGAQIKLRMLYDVSLATKLSTITFIDYQDSGMSATVKLEQPKKDK